jgi:hypothetical protein
MECSSINLYGMKVAVQGPDYCGPPLMHSFTPGGM